jgi:hypothetical protein
MNHAAPAGGLDRVALRRLRRRALRSNRARLALLVLVGASLLLRLGFLAAQHSWTPVAVVGAICVLGGLSLVLLERARRGSDALGAISPQTADTVRTRLAAAGLPEPDVLRVQPQTGFSMYVHRGQGRRELRVCLALALAAPPADLAVAAAWQLTVAQEPDPVLAAAVWRKRLMAQALYNRLAATGRSDSTRGRRAAAFLQETDRFAADLRQRADSDAIAVAGDARSAAAALYRIACINEQFGTYVLRFIGLIVRQRRVPAHLYTGWLTVVQEGSADWERLPIVGVDAFLADHPRLALVERAGLESIPRQLLTGRAAGAPDSAVPADLERRFARRFGSGLAAGRPVRAQDEELIDPTAVYSGGRDDPELRQAAQAMLGHPPSRAELAGLILSGATRQLAKAAHPDWFDEREPDGGLGAGLVLARLLTAELGERGLYQLDVLRPRLLTGPDGKQVDVAEIVTSALASPQGAAGLTEMLTQRPGAHALGGRGASGTGIRS